MTRTMIHRRRAGWVVAGTLLVGSVLLPASAWADEPGETDIGYLLVQQALGHLAEDTGDESIKHALEKVGDAIETDEQEGVDVAAVERAQASLEAGQVDEGRTLLEGSISEAVAGLPAATGEETGTGVVLPRLSGSEGASGADGVLLGASVLLILGGGVLAYRFRPENSVGELRRRLEPVGDHPSTGARTPEGGER